MSNQFIKMAIAYDFDGTLAPGNMQEDQFIPKLGMDSASFWEEANALAKQHNADHILTYMYLMLKKAIAKDIKITRDAMCSYAQGITFFPGVERWFDRLNHYAREKGIELEHYIISSGLREMIEGTRIAKHFTKIYASGFWYDSNDVAVWPATAVNYTTKTQFLFRINKGKLEESDEKGINAFVPHEKRPIPFRNMVFIGDGDTDIPSMRLIKEQGGYAIAVYASENATAKERADRLVMDKRANLALPADYREEGPMDQALKAIIDSVSAHYRLLAIQQLL